MKTFILIFIIGLCSIIYSSLNNTWKWASDFNGLVILASLSNEERSYNPYSQNFSWVSQDVAILILKNMDYPYERCSPVSEVMRDCHQPKIEYVSRLIGIVEPESEIKLFEIIQFLIQRGEPIDAYNNEGFTALQAAILSNSPQLVTLLLDSGANPALPINHKGELQGKNSYEFLKLLSSKNKEGFSELRGILNKKDD